MAHQKLDNTTLEHSWTSYAASAFGVLRGAGWWQDEFWKFMGHTGIAFHFIMHRETCPSSVTVYEWSRVHLEMMDRIGIATEQVWIENPQALNTAGLILQGARDRIRHAIETGHGVVTWTPTPLLEFGILNGYDDEDGVFFVDACGMEKPSDPLLFENLGKSEVPSLYYQLLLDRILVPEEKTIRSALSYGLAHWNAPFHITPDYASGRNAYNNLLHALRSCNLNPFGLGYVLAVYHDAKQNLARYFAYLNKTAPFSGALNTSETAFHTTATLFGQMAEKHPFSLGGNTYDPAVLPELTKRAEEALNLEERAFAEIAYVLGA